MIVYKLFVEFDPSHAWIWPRVFDSPVESEFLRWASHCRGSSGLADLAVYGSEQCHQAPLLPVTLAGRPFVLAYSSRRFRDLEVTPVGYPYYLDPAD